MRLTLKFTLIMPAISRDRFDFYHFLDASENSGIVFTTCFITSITPQALLVTPHYFYSHASMESWSYTPIKLNDRAQSRIIVLGFAS